MEGNKIHVKYTYPKIKKKYINNGKINLIDDLYIFESSDKNTIIEDSSFTIEKAIDEFRKNFVNK
jgi:hypothetical protein